MNKRWLGYFAFAVGYLILTFVVSVYLPNPFVSNPEAANSDLIPQNLSAGVACSFPVAVSGPFGWLPDLPRGLPLPVYSWVDYPQCYSADIQFNQSNALGDALIWITLPIVGLGGFWLGRRSKLPRK